MEIGILKMQHEMNNPKKLNDDILKVIMDSDLRQTIKKLSLKIGCPWSTVQDQFC